MGRLRLWIQVGCVVAVLVAAVLAADRAYESRQPTGVTDADVITVKKTTIAQACSIMARAIPGVATEMTDGTGDTDRRLWIIVPADADPQTVDALENLVSVLPLDECNVEVFYATE